MFKWKAGKIMEEIHSRRCSPGKLYEDSRQKLSGFKGVFRRISSIVPGLRGGAGKRKRVPRCGHSWIVWVYGSLDGAKLLAQFGKVIMQDYGVFIDLSMCSVYFYSAERAGPVVLQTTRRGSRVIFRNSFWLRLAFSIACIRSFTASEPILYSD